MIGNVGTGRVVLAGDFLLDDQETHDQVDR